jgi:hypothetical protein
MNKAMFTVKEFLMLYMSAERGEGAYCSRMKVG